jgi:hypothetical protein
VDGDCPSEDTVGFALANPVAGQKKCANEGDEVESDRFWFGPYIRRQSTLNHLHLAQCNFVLCPVVKLGCSGRLMSGHLLGVLEPSVVFQVNRDAGCPPGGVAARCSAETDIRRG